MYRLVPLILLLAALIASCDTKGTSDPRSAGQWLAGDHHVHSEYSVLWNREVDPPVPLLATDGTYPISKNVEMAKYYGLAWMVTTDHGGRLHAKLNLEEAYPRVLEARRDVPDLIQFFGIELHVPGGDHASVVMPHTHDEADRIYHLESRFDREDADPADTGADTVERMLEALSAMKETSPPPVVIANHPSRYATGGEDYGRTRPQESTSLERCGTGNRRRNGRSARASSCVNQSRRLLQYCQGSGPLPTTAHLRGL